MRLLWNIIAKQQFKYSYLFTYSVGYFYSIRARDLNPTTNIYRTCRPCYWGELVAGWQAPAICGNDGTVQVIDTSNGHMLWQASVAHYAFAVAWSPDGSMIASASADGTVQIWRPQV